MSASPNAAGNHGSPYQVPPEPNRWPAIGMAVGVHALLLAFLYFGISWQNNTPVAVEAEVWDVTTQTAAPPPPPPQPQETEPEPPPPTPVPKTAPPPEVEEPVAKPPDIALAREKKRKEELKKQRLEEERQEREREIAQKREEAEKLKRQVEQKQRELADEKKREQELAKKKEEADKKKLAEKEKADKLAKAKAEKAEQAKLDKLRNAEMQRMMAAAGNGTSGSAEKSTAPRTDKGYTAAITAKVKGNTSYAGSLDEPGNPTATFRVEQLPTGEIIAVKKVKSSGVPSFDDAVEKGITKSSPLPKKKDGTVERSLLIEFHMKDLQ